MKSKRILSVLLTLTLILTLLPVTATAAASVGTYSDLQTACSSSGSDTEVKLTAHITNGTATLTISRSLTLDLNGKNLTIDVRGSGSGDGIKIASGVTLTIKDNTYTGSSANKLIVKGGPGGAGINVTDGTLIIESGIIDATGGIGGGAGIGGGSGGGSGIGGAGGNITINGGTVTATGHGGAGIGGGNGGTGGEITINGGMVTATGDNGFGAGIGGGNGSAGGNITISGGTVTATGGTVTATGGGYGGGGAGIGGGGYGGAGGKITISGDAKVEAAGGGGTSASGYAVGGGAGIGSGGAFFDSSSKLGNSADFGNITIGGNANVTATGGAGSGSDTTEGHAGAGIGSGGGAGTGAAGGLGSISITTTGTVAAAGGAADGGAYAGASVGTGGGTGGAGSQTKGYLIAVISGAGGSISPGSRLVTSSGDQTFTITPDSGYAIATVTVDSNNDVTASVIGSGNLYTFSNVTADHTIAATFCKIGASPASLDFGDVQPGQTSTETLAITGQNLTNNITYALSGDTAAFSVTETSWPAASGGTLTVTFAPTAVQMYSAELTLQSTGALNVTVSLSGTGVNQSQTAPSGLGKTDETAARNDGTITGVTTDMEYKEQGASGYTAVTGTEITGLAPGDYLVRYAAKTGFDASPDETITIAAYAAPPIYIPPTPENGFESGGAYTQGSGTDLVHITKKNFSYFGGLRLDGKTLARDADYSAESGSTVVTVFSEFLDTLEAGMHKLEVRFTDGAVVTAEFEILEKPEFWENPFYDVFESDWFYGDVEFVYTNGLMTGTSTDPLMMFSPGLAMTRAMAVTILWRESGEVKAGSGELVFSDVPEGEYYTQAVKWASSAGIVTGFDGTFCPEQCVTRQDLAVILWRYAKYIGMDVSVGEDTNILSYNDAFDVAEYAIPAMQWACGAGVITGSPDGLLDPQGTSSRAEAAAMLHRFFRPMAN